MNAIELIKEKNNRGGIMYNERYLMKNYLDIYELIISFCNKNNLDDISFNRKVYHFVNDIKEKNIKCSNPFCDNYVEFKNSNIGYRRYCSNKCVGSDPKIIKIKEKKSLEKFGTRTPAESDIIKEKIIKTNLEKYGRKVPIPINEINKKLQEKYNVENISQIDYIKNKVKETKLLKYGDSGYNNYEQIKKTNKERYGYECSFQNELVKEKIKKKFLIKYGYEHPSKNDIIKQKTKETMLKLYNCENPSQSDYIQKIKRINKINKTLKRYDYLNIIDVDYDNKIFKFECVKGHKYEISFELFQNRKRIDTELCIKCNPIKSNSGQEIQLQDYIKSNYDGKISLNDRNIVGKELDIYIPGLKLAFEFNGIYWHNELYKSPNYHLKKTDLCEEKGIQLIHIYQDDWIYKNDIVKSMILNKLGKTENKIYARKTEIREITDNKLIREFLEKNHIQGFIGSKIKLGLFYNEELVSLMIFGNLRKNLGTIKNENHYELLRFCSKLNTNVVGGANKLFKYFINEYKPESVISYANRSWTKTDDNLYLNLGFNFVHKTQSNYHYVVDGVRRNRFLYRKDVLIKEGYSPDKTERDIMFEREIYRIYDSGCLKFEFI